MTATVRSLILMIVSATVVGAGIMVANTALASPTQWDCRTVVNDFYVGNNTYLTGDVCQRFESTNDTAQGYTANFSRETGTGNPKSSFQLYADYVGSDMCNDGQGWIAYTSISNLDGFSLTYLDSGISAWGTYRTCSGHGYRNAGSVGSEPMSSLGWSFQDGWWEVLG
jgi:hypothetical protein